MKIQPMKRISRKVMIDPVIFIQLNGSLFVKDRNVKTIVAILKMKNNTESSLMDRGKPSDTLIVSGMRNTAKNPATTVAIEKMKE